MHRTVIERFRDFSRIHPLINQLITAFIIFTSPGILFPQQPVFHKDSLDQKPGQKENNILKNVASELVKGVLRGDYKKPGWNEYVPRDNMGFDRIPLVTRGSHPRMISVQQIQSAQRSKKLHPYRRWYQKMRKQAANYNLNNESERVFQRTNHLKLLAFLYLIDNEDKYLHDFITILNRLPVPPRDITIQGGILGKGWGDYLESAQAISSLAVALDLVFEELPLVVRNEVLEKIMLLIQQLINGIPNIPANNHLHVIAIAFLQVAMLVDNPQAFIPVNRNQLWNMGLQNLSRSLGRVAPDGGYAEGVYYAGFIMSYLSPFIVHFKNITGVNLLNQLYLERLVGWYMANDKGSSSYALFDDALMIDYFFLPILTAYSRNAGQIDHFWKSQRPATQGLPNMVEAMCVYRPSGFTERNAPDAVQIYPEMGQVIFKDDWLKPDIFATFLGERERWFADRHEQIEPLSMEISAYGQDIIVDAGYGQWVSDIYRTLWYKSPYAHNGIFINGLGTYHNPIWGDSIGSSLNNAFRTPKTGSATLRSRMQGTKLGRKVCFIKNRLILMIDEIDGQVAQDVAMNFNYSGNLLQVTADQIRIDKNDVSLNMLHMGSVEKPVLLKRNFGLRTARMPVEKTAAFQFEHQNVTSGIFVTLFTPSNHIHPPPVILPKAILGRGKAYNIRSDNSETVELAVNSGDTIAASDWKTDAGFVSLQFDNKGELEAFLIVHATYFKFRSIEIRSDASVSVYLEKNELQWLGYVENKSKFKEYHLTVSGIPYRPLRFNHHLVSKMHTHSLNTLTIQLKGSGSLEFGTGSSRVILPYRHHYNDHFIDWLVQRYQLNKNYDAWSDHDQQMVKNLIVQKLQYGLEKAAEGQSNDLFGNPGVIRHGINALGLTQETVADQTQTTMDVTHRYAYSGRIREFNWDILEDGTFTEKGIFLRNLRLRSANPAGAGLEYRYYHFFQNHGSHFLKLSSSHRSFLSYQTARSPGDDSQQIEIYQSGKHYYLHPGYSWSSASAEESQFLRSGLKNYQMSILRNKRDSGQQYYESLSGFGNNWSFSFQGEQINQHIQRYSEDHYLRFFGKLNLAQGMRLEKRETWKMENAYTRFNLNNNRYQVYGYVNYHKNELLQGLGYHYFSNDRAISGYVDLENFTFNKNNELRLEYHQELNSNLTSGTALHHRFLENDEKYVTNITQSVVCPLTYNVYVQPVMEFMIPNNRVIEWLGSNITITNRYTLFSQILIHPEPEAYIIDYQLAVRGIRMSQRIPLEIWLHAKHYAERIQSTEVAFLTNSSSIYPGLYYSYDRNVGIRWEGYLQWRW